MEVCDFVDFSLAVKLKEKGFNKECLGWYYPSEACGFDYKTTIVFNSSAYRGSNYKDMLVSHEDEKHIDAPTISQVLKWLRKKYFIHISTKPHPCEDRIMWMYEIRKFSKHISAVVKNKTGFVEEEQATLAGIEYVLDNLI